MSPAGYAPFQQGKLLNFLENLKDEGHASLAILLVLVENIYQLPDGYEAELELTNHQIMLDHELADTKRNTIISRVIQRTRLGRSKLGGAVGRQIAELESPATQNDCGCGGRGDLPL
jgi:hypothetical protein